MHIAIADAHFVWCHQNSRFCACKKTAYLIACFVALWIGAGEFSGSIFSGSFALWADGAHMLKDSFGYVGSYFGAVLMSKKASEEDAQRVNRVVGGLSALFLLFIAVGISYEAVHDIVYESTSVSVQGMMVFFVAGGAFVLNLVLFKMFHLLGIDPHGHGHGSHGSGHHHEDHMLLGAKYHAFGDMMISAVTVATGLAVYVFGPSYSIYDRYASIVISLILIASSIKILWGIRKETASLHGHR